MFDLTYSILASYTASDFYEQKNEEARYRQLGGSPEELYVSLFRNNNTLANLVASGLYKVVCANIAEVTQAPDYYYDNIVTLLLCPEYPQTPRRFLELVGQYGVPVDEFYKNVVSVLDVMNDYANRDVHPVIKSVFGVDVQVATGYTEQVEEFVTGVIPELRNGLKGAALCAVIRRFLCRSKVLCLCLSDTWLQFDAQQLYMRSVNWERLYMLSTMLTQTKRSSKYGDTELKCIRDGRVVCADESPLMRTVLIGHVIGNLGLLISRLSVAEYVDIDLFKEKYWEYKDCQLVAVGDVRVRKGSRLALENDAYEILMTVKAKEPVLTLHIRGTDSVLTTNKSYWEIAKPVDKVEELRNVLSMYIQDEQDLSDCLSKVTTCKGWRK